MKKRNRGKREEKNIATPSAVFATVHTHIDTHTQRERKNSG